VPLSERRDLLNANEHYTLFQNAEEVLSSLQHTLKDLIRVAAREGIEIKLNYTCRFSPYRAVNTLRLGYTNQSVNNAV
jgi:hypothetical protein